ncbi:hypothetical protein [Actinomadura sp. 3N508]|uniref:hypothetical protein n=1 Tax=Actinomadura sp. 3N508 TaxID=3375153 RepID=UPI003799CBEF
MLRTLQNLGWNSLPKGCRGWNLNDPSPSRAVAGISAGAGLVIRVSSRPLTPAGRQEERYTQPHRPDGAHHELRGVDLALLSTLILNDRSHIMAISIDIKYHQVWYDEPRPWGPI